MQKVPDHCLFIYFDYFTSRMKGEMHLQISSYFVLDFDKTHFNTNKNFVEEILIFEQARIMNEKQKTPTIYLREYFAIHIL